MNGGGGPPPPRTEPLKFEGDFDFDAANAEFDKDKITAELRKISISDKGPVMNGGSAAEVVVEDHEDEEVEEEEESGEVFYDKAKSFFDNISCEATEREKGHRERPNWREERKTNTETFGAAAAMRRGGRGRGGFRGRGGGFRGGRGRGFGGGGGGYGGGGFRGGRGGGAGGGAPSQQSGRGGGRRERQWVDYEFNYEAAGLDRARSNGPKPVSVRS